MGESEIIQRKCGDTFDVEVEGRSGRLRGEEVGASLVRV
jgi:hypothetical protein